MAWLTSWNYRKAVTISNTGSVLTDYQTLITTDTASLVTALKMQSDCRDIRFTSSDGSTLLNYWIESGQNTASTKIWIKSTLANGNNTVYMYYGNPSAVSASNGAGTFGAEFWGMRDFTTYEEIDPQEKLTVDSATKVTAAVLNRLAFTYLRKDLGSTLMTDFELKFDFFLDYVDTYNWEHGRALVLILSDKNFDNVAYVGDNSIALDHYRTNKAFYLDVTATPVGSGYDVSALVDFQGYATMRRVGSDVSLTVYTDAARTNQIYTQSGTQGTAYRYISIWYSFCGYGYNEWGNVQNVSIRKYASPEPTLSALGTEQTAPNITATLMTITPSETPCRVGICTVSVNVTWTNNGETSGDFIPNITIDGTPYSSPYPLQSLGSGLSDTKTFVISDLVAMTHTICPNPN